MLTNYFAQILLLLYHFLGNNLGLAIITLTLIIKFFLLPITLNSLKATEKIKRIQPELDKLKKKHKKDPKKLQEAQMGLFKKHKVNPLASFIPQIIQIVIFIMLYRLLIGFLKVESINGEIINTTFLWMDLTKPDPYYILPIITAASQFALSYLMQGKQINKKETKDDSQNLMVGMGKTMLYVMPLITGLFALKFPSGLVVYWIISNLFSLAQQFYIVRTTNNLFTNTSDSQINLNNPVKKNKSKANSNTDFSLALKNTKGSKKTRKKKRKKNKKK